MITYMQRYWRDALDATSPPQDIDVLLNVNTSWHTHSDKDYGGLSISEVHYFDEHMREADDPVLRFNGVLKEHSQSHNNAVQSKLVGSFSAVKSDALNYSIDLADYPGIELVVKSNSESKVMRRFSLNLTTKGTLKRSGVG